MKRSPIKKLNHEDMLEQYRNTGVMTERKLTASELKQIRKSAKAITKKLTGVT